MPVKSTRFQFTILKKIVQLIPPHLVATLARKHEVWSHKHTPWSHVVTMLFAQLTHAIGLIPWQIWTAQQTYVLPRFLAFMSQWGTGSPLSEPPCGPCLGAASTLPTGTHQQVNDYHAKRCADHVRALKKGLDLLGRRARGYIRLDRDMAKKPVPDGAANNIGLMAGLTQEGDDRGTGFFCLRMGNKRSGSCNFLKNRHTHLHYYCVSCKICCLICVLTRLR